jgi:2',3'-cyclic-nucleotide 2'-phosphodiesterase (5'-nucleotidase family)
MTIDISRMKPIYLAALLLLIQCQPKLLKTHQAEFYVVSDSVQVDPQARNYIWPYKEKLDAKMKTVIGESVKELDKSGRGETALGNFVADMQKEYAEEEFGYPIDISIINNGGLRNTLPQGNITLGNVFELSPFDNYLFVLALSAQDVEKLAQYAVEKKNLGINGMYIESENNELTHFTVDGKPVEKGKTYLLAVNDYLATGGDQMSFLMDLPRKEVSDILLRDLLIEKIKEKTAKGEKLDAEIEGRQKLQ